MPENYTRPRWSHACDSGSLPAEELARRWAATFGPKDDANPAGQGAGGTESPDLCTSCALNRCCPCDDEYDWSCEPVTQCEAYERRPVAPPAGQTMTRQAFVRFIQSRGFPDDVFAVGDGWLGILARLIDLMIAAGWDRTVLQVKEKYGTLRFYTGPIPDACYDAIDDACRESARTCEDCGAPGVLRDGRAWIRTLCDSCDRAH